VSWSQLQSIVAEARDIARDEATRPPVACPDDGEPLREGKGGVLHCRFCGYTWPAIVGGC